MLWIRLNKLLCLLTKEDNCHSFVHKKYQNYRHLLAETYAKIMPICDKAITGQSCLTI